MQPRKVETGAFIVRPDGLDSLSAHSIEDLAGKLCAIAVGLFIDAGHAQSDIAQTFSDMGSKIKGVPSNDWDAYTTDREHRRSGTKPP